MYNHSFSQGIAFVISMFIAFVIILLGYICIYMVDTAKWNDGHCHIDGTSLTLIDRVGHLYTTDYYYQCEDGHTIILRTEF